MEVCLEAVQLFGDANVLQICGGTEQAQISQVAPSLLRDARRPDYSRGR
jgi:hypothetical protein